MNGTEVKRGKTEGREHVMKVWTTGLATESLASKDALQCELMQFLKEACMCSCVLYELENGQNGLSEKAGRADGA